MLFRKAITPTLLAAGLLFASCASTSTKRGPASAEEDQQSVELASKLKGGSVKLRAYRDGDQVSVLGFVDIKFKECQAVVNSATQTGSETDFEGSYVDCLIEMKTDPVHLSTHAKVKGDKRNFRVEFSTEQSDKYSLSASIDMSWQNKKWNGQGKVDGWVSQKISDESSITATVKETLSF